MNFRTVKRRWERREQSSLISAIPVYMLDHCGYVGSTVYGRKERKEKRKQREKGKIHPDLRWISALLENRSLVGTCSRVECVAANIKRYLTDKSVLRYRYSILSVSFFPSRTRTLAAVTSPDMPTREITRQFLRSDRRPRRVVLY